MLFLHKVPKNHSVLWALNAHVMSSECSSVDDSAVAVPSVAV